MVLRHVSQAVWVAGGQAATAVGTIVGLRMLTEVVPPATFGVISLTLGIAALGIGVLWTPLAQATLHFHSALLARREGHQLQDSLHRFRRRAVLWSAAPVAVSAVAYTFSPTSVSPLLVALAVVLLMYDGWRSVCVTLLNAARDHRRYALWMTCDAWLKPLLGALAVLVIGESAIAVLAAYAVAAIVLVRAFGQPKTNEARAPAALDSGTRTDAPAETGREHSLDRRLWRYALPLVPLGFIGWANGLSDRYLVGGLLSVADAGIYAAAYGLASRPLLMIGGTIELMVRPVFQSAVHAGDHGRVSRLLVGWLAATSLACMVCVGAILLFSDELAALLLGADYRSGARLMPWIAAGYALLAISQVFERVCYAHAHTKRVLLIQSFTAVAAVVATAVGILEWGLAGAAFAVPVYFAVQLGAAMFFAHRSHAQRALVPLEAGR